MYLNFEKLTLMIGFVLQGHILYVKPAAVMEHSTLEGALHFNDH